MSDPTRDPIDWPRLGRYLAGECSASEADELRRWIEAEPARAELIASLDAMGKAGGELPSIGAIPTTDEDRAWRTMRARIAGIGSAPRPPGLAPIVRSRAARWPIAAAVLLAAGGALLWNLQSHPAAPITAPQSWREV